MAGEAVIFIPGIKGTKLVETNRATWDTVWSGIQSNFESIEDLELTAARQGRFYEENPYSIIQPGEIETLAYGEFLRDLDTEAPIYIFNYDWRLSASHNGARLAQFMDYLVEKSKARSGESRKKHARAVVPIESFDFITHSLGNFILRNYLHNHGFKKVNKIVFTVPPFQGSIDIVSAALVGEGFLPGVKARIRKFIRTMPGALELLPDYPGASRFVPSGAHSFFTFNHWQSNITGDTGSLPAKMKGALNVARRVVRKELCDLSSLPAAERERILVIVRGGFETWQSIRVHKKGADNFRNLVDFEGACRTPDGDGRVPHISSCCYCESVQTLLLEDTLWYRDYGHGFVLKDERLQRLVNRFLFGRKRFDHTMPGGSVRRVSKLSPEADEETGLPFWTPVTS